MAKVLTILNENLNKMNKPILEFRKTDHFLYRQWCRGVDNKIISNISNFIQNIDNIDKVEILVLILKGRVFITCYWKEFSELFFGRTKFKNPIII